jgi:hypothetical protein
MRGHPHFITHDLDKAIEKLAIWLSQQPDSAGIIRDTLKTLHSIRKNGFYNDKEKDLLNTIRNQYYLEKENENDL